MFCVKHIENEQKLAFCVGAYGKLKEHIGVASERMQNTKKTKVLLGNLWRTIEHICLAYGNLKENPSVAWEPMENILKTHVFRWTYKKRKENTGVALDP